MPLATGIPTSVVRRLEPQPDYPVRPYSMRRGV